jgi:hypothetical protein
MEINWHDVATIVATMSVLGGIMIALLKGFFVTTKGCQENQKTCLSAVCKKIDELKDDIKDDRRIANDHYAEIMNAIGLINGKIND